MRLAAATAVVVVTFCAAPLPAQTPALSGPLTYDQALDLASSRNLAVAAARRARAIREGAVKTAGLRPNPSASFEVSRDTPHEVFVFALPVELGGKRGRRIDLATEELTLADVDVQTELRTLRRELRQAFYSVIAADERIRLADSLVDVARRVREVAQAMFETGAVPRLDVLAADLGVARAETEMDLARGTRTFEQARLNAVLDFPPQQATRVAGSLTEGIADLTYERALTIATASNVDLIALDRQIAVEERRVAVLRAERTPTPTFSVSSLFDNPGEFTAGAGAGVSLELPLFSRNQGQIAESLATTAQLRARRASTLRVIENTIAGTVARIDAERRQIEAFERRLVPTATDLQALAEESYRAGRTSVLGLLESQRVLRELRRDALQAALDRQLSIAELEEILVQRSNRSHESTKARNRHVWFRVFVFSWLIGLSACGKGAEEKTTEPAEVPTIVAETAPVTRKTLVDELVVRGPITAMPNEDVKVSALVPGRVNAVTVAEGDSVREGQVIAQLERQPLEDQRRQATAAVDLAKAQVENGRLALQRNQQLFERGIAAGKDVEDAKKDVASAQAALDTANAALSTAVRNVERAAVRSPISGQVVKRMVSVGEQVDGTAAQPIAQIANLDRVELAANVPADYLSRVKVGLAATLKSDAYADRTFPGTILAIAPAVDPATNAALARIRVSNPGHALKVGMFAEAHVAVAEHANALVVPPSAIVRDQEGAAAYVLTGDTAQRTAVKVGLEQPDAVEILDGLTEGQTVLTSNVYGLGEKAKVTKPGAEEKSDKPEKGEKPEKP